MDVVDTQEASSTHQVIGWLIVAYSVWMVLGLPSNGIMYPLWP